ncbi:hypothetical protein M5D96_011549, partial [Drosophila gunungcola]
MYTHTYVRWLPQDKFQRHNAINSTSSSSLPIPIPPFHHPWVGGVAVAVEVEVAVLALVQDMQITVNN